MNRSPLLLDHKLKTRFLRFHRGPCIWWIMHVTQPVNQFIMWRSFAWWTDGANLFIWILVYTYNTTYKRTYIHITFLFEILINLKIAFFNVFCVLMNNRKVFFFHYILDLWNSLTCNWWEALKLFLPTADLSPLFYFNNVSQSNRSHRVHITK